jgi:hypothetical protein
MDLKKEKIKIIMFILNQITLYFNLHVPRMLQTKVPLFI